ncbi:gene transfer agent family protein [Sulfitobacter mediterraneus]|uniref:gene transfer agent family protein n=1 Tax=Sulfitobacter mediterraneus TaxID=83219 RepID=UPI001934B1DA|nr:gene transfer agent family protein [Sulfitobacter mediterraneus]MBM1309789.1 gene transfer agent family protein [Sulfitobacter mediterraneus]MBM1313674.1 gene transfer agent family protein [Sulfitobacter mediterraneus]MBM1322058.1 gene transfer agent family protein [Sulfitobacter mediterraneus]MBM1325945.1 gene transfer agent family protein [Sulfitobacter mediterraneus]MBM1397291.1 gene transfer agent family protein [Sulfitobacter mediterraneus]
MANRWRGEVALTVNGQRHLARLSLGALAALEETLEVGSLVALVERFETRAFSSRDVLALLGAGLRGGGAAISDADLAEAEIEGGPVAAAKVAAELLARAFVVPE